jgi:hypothetical protein
MFIHLDRHEKAGTTTTTGNDSLPRYDEQFILKDHRGRALAHIFYTVRLPTGELVHGVTDSVGQTTRYQTDGANRIAVYLGHREA